MQGRETRADRAVAVSLPRQPAPREGSSHSGPVSVAFPRGEPQLPGQRGQACVPGEGGWAWPAQVAASLVEAGRTRPVAQWAGLCLPLQGAEGQTLAGASFHMPHGMAKKI